MSGNVKKPFFSELWETIDASKRTLEGVVKGDDHSKKIKLEQINYKNISREVLAGNLVAMYNQLITNIKIMGRSSNEVETHMKKENDNLSTIKMLQNDLIVKDTNQIDAFQECVEKQLKNTLKTELKSYSDATKQNLGESLTIRNIKTAVKDVVKNVAENNDRSRNLIIFGLNEETNENVSRKVSDVFQALGQKPHFEATRFGKDEDKRPIKVKFDRSETVYELLRTAKKLKLTTSYKQVYLSADRTPDQRVAQKKLVEELKEKVRENPEQHYYVKGGKVLCQPQKAAFNPSTTTSNYESDDQEESPAVFHERFIRLARENMASNLAEIAACPSPRTWQG